jgi:hypothetical protein
VDYYITTHLVIDHHIQLLPLPPASIKLTPISVKALAQESGKEASKATDGDFATRWLANGYGQWIGSHSMVYIL